MQHVIFALSILFSIPLKDRFDRRYYPTYIFSFIILFLFSALRYGYGNDYWSYYWMHSYLIRGFKNITEFGFEIFLASFRNFFMFIVVHSFIQVVTYYVVIKTFVPIQYRWLSLLILLVNPNLFLIQLSAIRQTLAIALIIFSIYFRVKSNKVLLSNIFAILAPLFHTSSVIAVPFLIFLPKTVTQKLITLLFYALLLFYAIGFLTIANIIPVQDLVTSFLTVFTSQFDFFGRYIIYLYEPMKNLFTVFLTYGVFAFLTLYSMNYIDQQYEKIFGYLFVLSSFFYILTIFHNLFARVAMYFEPFGILFLPAVLESKLPKTYKFAIISYFLIVYIYKYFGFFTEPIWRSFRNYKTILSAF